MVQGIELTLACGSVTVLQPFEITDRQLQYVDPDLVHKWRIRTFERGRYFILAKVSVLRKRCRSPDHSIVSWR